MRDILFVYLSRQSIIQILFGILFSQSISAQVSDFSPSANKYDSAFDQLKALIEKDDDFKKAVFITEQIFLDDTLNYDNYDMILDGLVLVVKDIYAHTQLLKYRQPDSINYVKNHSIFSALFDSSPNKNLVSESEQDIPYSFQVENPFSKTDWSNTFISKLLLTRKGDCHSLSYLYKIIADKIGAKCWLALAPNHIYIKNFSQQYGWYNTELTSRSFPSDAWIMSSGYISGDAIRSKIYMDTLSNQQSIGLCVLDLAKAYEYETGNYYDGFILKCCDLVLQYHATNPMALLLKAETLKKVYLKQQKESTPTMKQAYDEMEKAYITLAKLHYREMPKEMYDKWVK